MSIILAIYVSILFYCFVPGILVTLPKNGNKFTIAIIHTILFGITIYFTEHFIWILGSNLEGFACGVYDCPVGKYCVSEPVGGYTVSCKGKNTY